MSERIQLINAGQGQLTAGQQLTEGQVSALNAATPSADDIISNMELYNEEINETVEVKTKPQKRKRRTGKAASSSTAKTRTTSRKRKNQVNDLDLDAELEKLSQQVDEAVLSEPEPEPSQAVEAESDMRSQILTLLKNSSNAPSDAQVKQWKSQHGSNGVHVMALGEGDVYVFTHLKRGQWKKIQEMMAKMQGSGQSTDVEDQLKEKVISHCVLWPRLNVEFFYNSRAGVADSLYQVILLNSYFLSPQQAMLLTTQL